MKEQERNERVKFMIEGLQRLERNSQKLRVRAEGLLDKYNSFEELGIAYDRAMTNIKTLTKTVEFTFESACRELEEEDES